MDIVFYIAYRKIVIKDMRNMRNIKSSSSNICCYQASNFISGFILNVDGKEKIGIAEGITQNTAGATNCPTRAEEVSKWTNTSQINIIDAVNTDTGDFAAGSSLIIWGSD